MRVLMLGWEFPPKIAGGLGTACHGLTRALDRLGHEVRFVLPGRHASSGPRPRAGFDLARFITVRAGFEDPYPGSDAAQSRYGRDLIAEAQRYASLVTASVRTEFDVIHAHDWLTFPAGLALASLAGRPLVVHVHSTEADRSGGRPSGAVGRSAEDIERLAVRAADRVIAVSSGIRRACVEHYGANARNVCVVHNGIEGRNRTPAPKRRAGASQRVVLFLGRITAQKGPALFLLAARRILETAPVGLGPIRFVMAGDGDELAAMRQLAADLGIIDRIEFPGFLQGRAVSAAYAAADLFLMTSVSEPFGLTALEAVQHGVPVILPPSAGATEVLPSAPTCPPENTAELARAAIELLASPDRAEETVRATQSDIRGCTWAVAAERCIREYGAAITQRNAAVASARATAAV